MITSGQIRWLAGLLEGEGCFYIDRDGKNPLIVVEMSDLDIINRVGFLFNRKVNVLKQRREHKQTWSTKIIGNEAVGWMQTLYFEMGLRRREQIRYCIRLWKLRSVTYRNGVVKNTPGISNELWELLTDGS